MSFGENEWAEVHKVECGERGMDPISIGDV